MRGGELRVWEVEAWALGVYVEVKVGNGGRRLGSGGGRSGECVTADSRGFICDDFINVCRLRLYWSIECHKD